MSLKKIALLFFNLSAAIPTSSTIKVMVGDKVRPVTGHEGPEVE